MTQKKSRRVIAIMMAMVMTMAMMFAMTTTSFAADGSVNVKIQMYGETYIDENVTDVAIAARTGSAAHLYTVPSGITHPAAYTAADAMIEAYYQMYHTSTATADQLAYAWDTYTAGAEGLYFTTYDGVSADTGNYYLEGTSTDAEGNTVYTYYWQGDSWSLYINGALANEYASRYDLSNVSNIVFDYNTVTSESFTSTSPIPGALPAPTK